MSDSLKLTGLPGGSKAWWLAQEIAARNVPLVVVTQEDLEAEGLAADLEAWLQFRPVHERPDLIVYPEFDAPGRISALETVRREKRWILICSHAALTLPALSPDQLKKQTLELRAGRSYPRSALLETFAEGGYSRTDMVQMEGEVAIRGEVIDLWPPDSEKPWRLVFNGDELESLRAFNPGTQRSEAYLTARNLLPLTETKASGSLADHIPPETIWFWDDAEVKVLSGDLPGSPSTRPPLELFYSGLPTSGAIDLGFFSTAGLVGTIERAAATAKAAKAAGKRVLFFSLNAGESERLQELLDEQLGTRGTEGMAFHVGPLRNGFQYEENRSIGGLEDLRAGERSRSPSNSPILQFSNPPPLLVLTNSEIFNRPRHRPRLPKFKSGEAIREVHDIKPGDYVVHEHYGIGRYRGLQLLRAADQEGEFLKVEYAKGDRLYVPLADFKQIQKYSGSEGKHPRLSSLDTSAWERVKARVQESVQELAQDLLKIHATRAALPGHAFPEDSHLEQEFAASFLYDETTDQLRAIEEIKKDMMAPRPMDRLLLGDVGYGKTEVAMRAAMKAVSDSKQVAVLVPTTILAEQHFRTLSERFADYPAKIGMISRFQSVKEVEAVLAGAAAGTIDIVIGTHRLLQKDMKFHNLGLLIIDEEHRFGVKHKEQFKKLRERLDVLTMTATPIPRTLSFAMSGMRDLSIIETPPTGRLPISTHVGPFDEDLIAKAVQQELDRNGQVFYVHNRVQSMQARLKYLKELLPQVSIAVVHGQMSGPAIEQVMWEFIHRKHQILLATSIIESGIDIPTVNTLIVEEAEAFGLSQLYQLRGRVGRERVKAHCYLFYSPGMPLSGDARARLEALREFTALGSGYRLAVRDMEIRGAGNLLGQQQHGHIAAVGLDMYTQLLQEEMAALRGEPAPVQTRFPSMDLAIHAYLPAEYLPSEELRILFYKKLVSAETRDALAAVRGELEDRFGPLPPEAATLLDVSELRLTARDRGIDGIVQKPSSLEIRFLQNTPVQPGKLVAIAHERAGLRFKPGPPFTLILEKVAYEGPGSLATLRGLLRDLV